MKNAYISATVLFLSLLAVTGCSTPEPIASEPSAETSTETSTPTAVATDTQVPSATAIPKPSPTPTPTLLKLEIVEWSKWADVPGYTNVEALVRNPNAFPVRVNNTEVSVINRAGEIVHTTKDVRYYLWPEDGWGLILPGETVPTTIHIYPANDGEVIPEWETLNLVSDLEEAIAIPYTRDLKVSLGGFRSTLEFEYGADLDVTNTSDQLVSKVLFRLIARNRNGAYLGVDNYTVYGNFDEAGNIISNFKPGESFHTIFLPTLTREPPHSIVYEITAIGLLAQG